MKMQLNPAAAALTANTFSNWLLNGMTKEVHEEIRAMLEFWSSQQFCPVLRGEAEELMILFDRSTLESLDKDWTNAFALGAGSTTPHESVARTGLVMQEPRDATLAWMRRWGVLPQTDSAEPEDHLGLQLAFFSRLAALALESDEDLADQALEAARRFALERLSWICILEDSLKAAEAPGSVVGMIDFLALFINTAFAADAEPGR